MHVSAIPGTGPVTAPPALPLPLSVCLIVRNEARLLPAALTSVQGIAAEIVVVDTGSTDDTVALAQAAGARVLHFPWRDDFAAARNHALAAATQPWILSLDADERLDPSTVPALAEAVRPARPGEPPRPWAQVVPVGLLGDGQDHAQAAEATSFCQALRLFRRDPRIRYTGRVHEDVAPALLAMGSEGWPLSGVRLAHVGYCDAQERERKRARNLALLRHAHAERPQDLFVCWKLAISMPEGDADERLALLLGAVDLAAAQPAADLTGLTYLPPLLAATVQALVARGRLVEAARQAGRLAPVLGGSSRFTWGAALARAGLVEPAREQLQAFLRHGAAHGHPAIQPDPAASPVAALRWLAWLAACCGEPGLARLALDEARGQTGDLAPEADLARLQLQAGDLDAVAGALNTLAARVRPDTPDMAELLLLGAELAWASGDPVGAASLADAVQFPVSALDDRGAALAAEVWMQTGAQDAEVARGLLARLPGCRFDTLAVRLRLLRLLDLAVGFEVPRVSVEMAAG